MYPTFELYGEPCLSEGCPGVRVNHYKLSMKALFKKCSKCGAETDWITPESTSADFEELSTLDPCLEKIHSYTTTT